MKNFIIFFLIGCLVASCRTTTTITETGEGKNKTKTTVIKKHRI